MHSRTGFRRSDCASSNNDIFDGESLSNGTRKADIRGSVHEFKCAQSPGAGGFGYTPLFLGSHSTHSSWKSSIPLLKTATFQNLIPSNSDLVDLMLSISSHRRGMSGFLQAWMKDVNVRSRVGRVRLLTAIGYILIDGDCSDSGARTGPLTWQDMRFLMRLRDELRRGDAVASEIAYLVSILLEDATQRDLSLKFRLENVLDFNDQITVRGWIDGGRDSLGTHSEELREDFHRRCRESGVPLEFPRRTQDLSPSHNCESLYEDDAHSDSSAARLHPTTCFEDDPFAHVHVEKVFGQFCFSGEGLNLGEMSTIPSTPRPRGSMNEAVIRESIVVDVQTDHALRRHINKAIELRKQFPHDRTFFNELRNFVLRRVHFESPETKGAIFKIASASDGFVHIGDVRVGASSRHLAILFKTLCDATGLYCRLVRDAEDAYYNVVMISDSSPAEVSEAENRRDGGNVSGRVHTDMEDRDVEEEEFDDAPEELVPVFWEGSKAGQQRRVKLSHPLDCLLQKCNSAADPVDLDDFFAFDKLLGKGSFGEVWKVDLRLKQAKKNGPIQNSGHSLLIPGKMGTGPFALKLIPPEEADKEEASFMRIYRHARVINVLAVFRGYQVLENRKRELEKKPAMCILMEMAEKCLETVLADTIASESSPKSDFLKPSRPLDLRFVFRILIDSARAMAFLHSPVGQRPHLVHRDLKPGNILITADSRAIVTDFGVARMNPSLETNLTVGAGTEGYMAPEQKTLLYDRPADVYSFGVIIARLLGAQQWKDATRLTIEQFADSADPVLVQLCLKCVQVSPLHRPSFEQIRKLLLCEFIKREFARNILQESFGSVGVSDRGQHGLAGLSNPSENGMASCGSPLTDMSFSIKPTDNVQEKARAAPKRKTRAKKL